MNASAGREIVISPDRPWYFVDGNELLHYRDLLYFLVRREFLSKYKQTILGPAWFVLQPLLTSVVFTLIFGRVAKIPTDHIPPTLFYLCGLLIWNYFSSCLNAVAVALTANAYILDKVYFPRLVIPLSIIVSNVFSFLLQLILFLVLYFYWLGFTPAGEGVHPSHFLWVLPLLFLQTAALSLGVGLWIAALTVKYRDFQHLLGFMTQLWLYVTPVIYPLSVIPHRWKWLAVMNPLVEIVEMFRRAFFGAGWVHPGASAISLGVTLVLLFSGLMLFNKVERTFVDTI